MEENPQILGFFLLQRELDHLVIYRKSSQVERQVEHVCFQFHPDKHQVPHAHKSRTNVAKQCCIHGYTQEEVERARYLWVTLMMLIASWDAHINHVLVLLRKILMVGATSIK